MRPDLDAVAPHVGPEHRELAEAIGEFAAERLAPLPAPRDDAEGRVQARRILELLGEGGWCRWAVPAAWGGTVEEVDLTACCLIREALAGVSPLADNVFALQCLGSLPLALAGGEEVRRRWLPGVARGEAMAGFAMTEPEAGSDVGSLATAARRLEDGYLLSGRKTLISNAGLADFYAVFAAIAGEGGEIERDSRGRARIGCFVVEAGTPGLEFAGAQVLSEPHPLGEIVFADCRVGPEVRLGGEGDGFKLGMRTLDRLRATVAAAACGMAGRALAEALSHAGERRQFGRRLGDFQLVQRKLALMATELTAARLLTYRAAGEGEAGGELTLRSSMAKLYATESAQRTVDRAVQILGGRGVLETSPVDRLYRAVRALRIYEGTSEIQQLVIARQLLPPSS